MEAINIAQGKFSQPRNRHAQDELLDRTFREVSEQPIRKRPAPRPVEPPVKPEPTLEELLVQPLPETSPAPVPQEPYQEASSLEPDLPEQEPVYEEEEYEDEESESPFLAFFTANRKVLLICICCVVLVALLGTIAGIVFVNTSDPYDNKILNNVSIAGINLGGMTKEEAHAAIEREFGNVYS